MKKLLAFLIFFPVLILAQPKNVIMESMDNELQRSMKELKAEDGIRPYFLSYSINENNSYSISATHGVLRSSNHNKSRYLDIDIRIGSRKLDNSHKIKERMIMLFGPTATEIAINDDPEGLKAALWQETGKSFREAKERFSKVKAARGLTVSESDTSDDFSIEKPSVYSEDVPQPNVDVPYWESLVKKISTIFNKYPEIYDSYVSFTVNTNTSYFVSSEGSKIKSGRSYIRFSIRGNILADDGMELNKYFSADAGAIDQLPDEKAIEKEAKNIVDMLYKLREAPITEPYIGPAILAGKASAVFFHEIFGHRVEGHRQKNDDEGQTFTKQINQQILPPFLSVSDDPTLRSLKGADLNGYYKYDDEGIKAQKVNIVENGLLKNFLMGRSPIAGFSNSNGHGRRQAGNKPVSRQGNLLIESTKSCSFEELKKKLIAECKKQNKPFGLLFDDNEGGFTSTGRRAVNAFKVIPVVVYKIYTDGRPDELIRGVDLIGTPLTCFSKIIATSDNTSVFSGFCGAESGSVPVTAISPDILVSEIEIQKKEKGTEKKPLLPPPSMIK